MWGAFFEHLRECGRDATLFIVAFLTLATALVAAPSMGWLTVPILAGPFTFALVRLVLAWRRALQGFDKLGRLPPLSDRDWRRARERLLRASPPRKAGGTQRIQLPTAGNGMTLRRR